MVDTIKFSQFAAENLNNANKYVGVGAGANFIGPTVIVWTTATRPNMPYEGLLGFNSDLDQYEFYSDALAAWVQLASTTTDFIWNSVAGTSQQMEESNGYVPQNVGITTFTLPPISSFGQLISICGYGAGGWTIVFNAGQNLVFGKDVATTTTGSLSSTNQYDQVELLCVVPNLTWVVRNVQGNLTIV